MFIKQALKVLAIALFLFWCNVHCALCKLANHWTTVFTVIAWGQEFEFQADLAQRYKRFATASTSTQVGVLPWRYDVEMGTVKGNNRISRTIVILYSRFC